MVVKHTMYQRKVDVGTLNAIVCWLPFRTLALRRYKHFVISSSGCLRFLYHCLEELHIRLKSLELPSYHEESKSLCPLFECTQEVLSPALGRCSLRWPCPNFRFFVPLNLFISSGLSPRNNKVSFAAICSACFLLG